MSVKIGDRIRLLDDSTGLAEGTEGVVVEDEYGYEGFFGEKEFTVNIPESGGLETWYVKYRTEGVEWEKVSE